MLFCIAIVLVILVLWHLTRREGFSAQQKVADLTRNRDVFRPSGTYADAKKRVPWVDPVTYYDAVELKRTVQFDPDKLMGIL